MSQGAMENEEIILSELPDSELVEQMFDDLYDGLADEIAESTQILLDRGWDAKKVLDDALVGGMMMEGAGFEVIDLGINTDVAPEYIVLVGGAPLNEEFGNAVGADAYCRDAATAVEVARKLVAEQRAAAAS